ncbi:hypothetical protein [Escherichia coli]|uniref:hypothetical protein n=1 Tax=Escherichia coli TaxID=562 RepID=UPI00191C8EF0|nr:hypothetical protein [Escherichia coli]
MNFLNELSDFDYSLVKTETAQKLKALSNQLDGIYQNYSVVVGEVLYKAQQELASYDDGTFQKWVSSKGISKSNAYNYINSYRLVQNLDNPKEKEIFLQQPKSIQYEMSKPSANPEVNQAVFNGDITTHKEYKELENKLKLSKQANRLLRDENEKIKSSKIEVKETIKEVVPEDYRATQDLNKQLLEKNKELSKTVKAMEERSEFIEKQLAETLTQREEVDKKSAQYDELTRAIEESQGQLDSVQKQISAYKNITSLLQKGNDFLASMGGLIYADEEKVLRADGIIRNEFDSFISRGLRFFNDLNDIRKESNILEGEFE